MCTKAIKIFLIAVLFMGVSSTTFASGVLDKIRNAASKGTPSEENQATVEAEVPERDASMSVWPDDPLLFMGQLTGHEKIIELYGNFDVAKLKKLLSMVNSGETDGSGRRYFAYSADLRPAPATSIQRRLDTEIALSRAARALNQETYVVDVEFTIRSHDGKTTYSVQNHAALEINSDIMLIGRKFEETISYVVDRGDDTYEYGIFYIFSAIPIENRDSDFYQIMAGIRGNNPNAINAILLEKIASKVEESK